MLRQHLPIILILALGLALRIPGIFWGEIDRPSGVVLEPDEFQHVALAADYVKQWGGKSGQEIPYRFWNTRAYGFQLGGLLFLAEKLGHPLSYHTKQAMIGRFLSTFYGIMLVLLLYHFCLFLFQNRSLALMAASLMAIFDLPITYSHYALPAAAYLFWAHAAVFGMIRYYYHLSEERPLKRVWRLELFLSLAIALSFGLKFDFLVIGMLGLCLLVPILQKKRSFLRGLTRGALILISTIFFFGLIHGFSFGWEDIRYAFQLLQSFNQNAIPVDQHWIHNPLLYLMGIMGGTSIWIVLASLWGTYHLLASPIKWNGARTGLLLFFTFVLLEFGVRWYIDTPFIRRVNVFLPFCAIMSAWVCYQLSQKSFWWAKLVFPLVALYTLSLSIYSQNNFWQDTRYKALSILQENPLSGKVYYSTYAKIPGMPEATSEEPHTASHLVIHETYYARYWKFFTTPFKQPKCCEEVYNCHGESLCSFYQELLSGQSEFELIHHIKTQHPFPERRLFKHWFGTYETFLGDLRVYSRKQ